MKNAGMMRREMAARVRAVGLMMLIGVLMTASDCEDMFVVVFMRGDGVNRSRFCFNGNHGVVGLPRL
jgi:hypothetical protein